MGRSGVETFGGVRWLMCRQRRRPVALRLPSRRLCGVEEMRLFGRERATVHETSVFPHRRERVEEMIEEDVPENPNSGRTPEVSIVLPIYNGRTFLATAIATVLEQTGVGFEVIAWDDASTDGSRELLEGVHDCRLRVFSNPKNLGLFATLNRAIGEARAPLIRLWAQDDVMRPGCLAAEREFLGLHPEVGLAYSLYDTIDGSGSIQRRVPRTVPEVPSRGMWAPTIISSDIAARIMYFYGSITGNIANVTIRSATLEKVGLFNEGMVIAGDFDMWERVSRRYPIGCIKEPLVEIRAHRGQLSLRPGVAALTMRESEEVFGRLFERLPVADRPFALRWRSRVRAVFYMNDAIRSAVLGHPAWAAEMVQSLRAIESPAKAFGLWVLSGGGRFGKPSMGFVLPVSNRPNTDPEGEPHG